MSRQKMIETLTQLLDLDEFEVVDYQEDRARHVRSLVVVPRSAVGLCPHCLKASNQRHQSRERVVRDLPLGSYATELKVQAPQYQCPACGKLFTPRFTALAESAHATERFLERLAEMVRFGDIQNAAAFFGLPAKTLEHWYYEHRERAKTRQDLRPIRSLGIDELSRKKSAAATAAC